MRKTIITIIIIILLYVLLLTVAVKSLYTDIKPYVKVKDDTEILKENVHAECLELIKRYNIYKIEGFTEQANDIARQYNSYILPYTELWRGNLPKDIVVQLPYVFSN